MKREPFTLAAPGIGGYPRRPRRADLAIGLVANLAFRLCDQALSGQILITQRFYAEVEDFAKIEPVGELNFKGFHKPVPAFQVLGLNTESTAQTKTG